jgi:nucleotide-binding universal stress UspA family protein
MSFAGVLKTIVVAMDLSGRSKAALEVARKLATAYGAQIVLAHGIDSLESAEVDMVPGQVLARSTEEACAVLDKLSGDLLQDGIQSHLEIRQGAVAQMLLDVVRQYEAGLIVIGAKGMEGAGPVIVDAVAERLVRLAPCPVLAVVADRNAGDFHSTAGGPVLLVMERNESVAAAAASAYSLAETFQRSLLVLHTRTAAEVAAFLNPHGATLEEFGIQPSGRFPVHYMVKDGNPADATFDTIAQYHPSILVVGVKRASDTLGPRGAAFVLLACSHVPVLCVPPDSASIAYKPEACAFAETR